MRPLAEKLLGIGAREAGEVEARFPKVHRRVGGYNIDALNPRNNRINLAHLLVGSEGTLAYSTAITLQLSPVLGKRALGVCHFGSFHAAMDAAQHLVTLKPIAVELVDDTMLGLAAEIPMFHATLDAMLKGTPRAILLVEFDSGEEENRRRMKALSQMMGDLGLDFSHSGAKWGGVVEVYDPALQNAITELRKSGLNIMMSMKDQAKPISFVEDCAVPLPNLAEYTAKLTECFERNGTRGTWYAHASEGCLHVRPVLNLRLEKDVKAMRAIAEEAFELVRQYKGFAFRRAWRRAGAQRIPSGNVRIAPGQSIRRGEGQFRSQGCDESGKIVRSPKFDSRDLFRYRPATRCATSSPRWIGRTIPARSAAFRARPSNATTMALAENPRSGAILSVLSRHPRRTACHPWPRQYAAPGGVGSVGRGSLHLG